MPRTCAGTNRNQLNKTKKREAVEREVRALESAVRAELWPLVFFRISPMAQHEGQRAMAMIHADRFRWEQDVLANPQLTAAQKIVLTRLALWTHSAGLVKHMRTAERLMAIARNPVLTKSESLLPPSSGDPTGGFREVFVFDAQ
jgi:hypothetical protein